MLFWVAKCLFYLPSLDFPTKKVSFYQQPLLWFLLAASIPVIIHLLNRRRHKTVAWAAMQFLLKATRESRGKKKLRHILILTARALGIACLATAAARPMIGGLLGWGGKQFDTIILILDRSASMETTPDGASSSRRLLALDRVRDAAAKLDSTRLVLIDSATSIPMDIPSPEVLSEITNTRATDTTADIPTLLKRAAEFILETQPGRTEIWIASDMQHQDWATNSERWATATASLHSIPQKPSIRILSLTTPSKTNHSLRLHSSYRNGDDLILDLEIYRSSDSTTPTNVPLTLALNGSKTTDSLTLTGQNLRFQKRLKLPPKQENGSGWLNLPGDSNPRDNTAYFAYAAARPITSLIVSNSGESLTYLTASAAPQGFNNQNCDIVAPAQFLTKASSLTDYAAIIWSAPLPDDTSAAPLRDYLTNGGQVVFFPPRENHTGSFLGVKWSPILTSPEGKFFILDSWNHDDGLLRDTANGTPLLGQNLRAIKRQTAEAQSGLLTSLAEWDDKTVFYSRMVVDQGTASFFASTPDYAWSNLGDAHLLLPAVQRAVSAGASRFDAALLASVNRDNALPRPNETRSRIDDFAADSSLDPAMSAGVYRLGERIIAANLPVEEFETIAVQKSELTPLFQDIPFSLFEDTTSHTSENEEREIWQLFLASVLLFLIAEAILCLQKRSQVLAPNLSRTQPPSPRST